jgi:hypothetical protein
VVDAKDVEPRNGTFRQMRARRRSRRTLGATAFGIDQVDLPPGAEGFEHDGRARARRRSTSS